MFKKLKVLLLAGVLAFSMHGRAFAENTYTSVIENPKMEEGTNQKVYTLQDGKVSVNVTANEDGSYYITIKWDSKDIKVVNVKTYYENGYEITSETQFRDGEACSTIIKDGDEYRVNLSDLIKSDLVKIEVTFEPVKGNEPVVPPEEPPAEEPEENVTDPEPETGDYLNVAAIGVGVVAVIGLVVLRKKE